MLGKRIITALLLLSAAALAIFLGGTVLRLLVFAFYLVGAYEFWQMRSTVKREEALVGAALLGTLPLSYWIFGEIGLAVGLPVLAMAFLAGEVMRTERSQHLGLPLDSLCHALLGLIYIGIFGTILFIAVGVFPRAVLCWFLLLVMAADTGAYFGGRAIGGKKLAPRISPGKTIAGAVAGIICAVAASLLSRHWLGLSPGWNFSSVLFGISSGVLIAVLAVFGDLIESLVKRIYEVKDSGSILPGHGGVLDRIDGLLFAAPALFFFCGAL